MKNKIQQLLLTSTAVLGVSLGSATSVLASADEATVSEEQATTQTIQDKTEIQEPDFQNDQGYSILKPSETMRIKDKAARDEAKASSDSSSTDRQQDINKATPYGLIVNQAVQAGDIVEVTDQSGNQVATFTASYDNNQGIQLMHPTLNEGETYNITVNDSTKQATAETVTMPEPPAGAESKERHDQNK